MLDLNGDKSISFEEFVNAQTFFSSGESAKKPVTDKVAKTRTLTAAQLREAKAVYKSFDTNGNGVVESSELCARMTDFGWTDMEITKTVASMDVNKDGKISQEEFMASYLDFIQFDDDILAD